MRNNDCPDICLVKSVSRTRPILQCTECKSRCGLCNGDLLDGCMNALLQLKTATIGAVYGEGKLLIVGS